MKTHDIRWESYYVLRRFISLRRFILGNRTLPAPQHGHAARLMNHLTRGTPRGFSEMKFPKCFRFNAELFDYTLACRPLRARNAPRARGRRSSFELLQIRHSRWRSHLNSRGRRSHIGERNVTAFAAGRCRGRGGGGCCSCSSCSYVILRPIDRCRPFWSTYSTALRYYTIHIEQCVRSDPSPPPANRTATVKSPPPAVCEPRHCPGIATRELRVAAGCVCANAGIGSSGMKKRLFGFESWRRI